MYKVTVPAKNEVEAAILVAGGVQALADKLGVSRETVRLWRGTGRFSTPFQERGRAIAGIPS